MSASGDAARRAPMSAERWAALEPHVDAALGLSERERAGYCSRLAEVDASLAADLARLLEHTGRSEPLFDGGAAERFWLLFDGERDAGEGELRARVQAALGDAYVIERELGGAGMARVFVAREPGLDRPVVLKVLPPELSADISTDRFAREIRLAASLQQANIVPLLAAGTVAGAPYYTMPFVDGRSLRDRLGRGEPLPIPEIVSILRDVARALSYAHSRGVVHRDIKPGNVLLSGGTAVVTDFGIAKALGAARAPGTGDTITRAGSSLGTPAYMAPEQASGDPTTDHRADIYSFGCMAYEMITGRPPFVAKSIHEIVAAHFKQTPRRVSELRSDVPPAVTALVDQCLRKEPARRPQSAAAILDVLSGGALPADVPRRRPRMLILSGLAAAALVASGIVFLARRAPPEPLTFALVPFRNLTRDSALDYRSDGIGDEILTALAKVPGVQIIGRSAARRYMERPGVAPADPHTVARELGVRFVITGSFVERDGRMTVSPQLNDSMARAELWAERFERDAKDVGPITDDIVGSLTDAVRARFPGRVGPRRPATSTATTTNSGALDLYLIAQTLVKHRGSGVEQGVASLERAIERDSGFARAYAALATSLQLVPYFVGTPPDDVKARTIAAATRALALDSTLADAHAALGVVRANAGEWAAADAEFRRATALEPDNVNARLVWARYLMLEARPDEAIAQLRRAHATEPVSALQSAWLSYGLYTVGRIDSALAESNRAIQLDSTLLPVTNLGALMQLATGHPDAARRLMASPTPVGAMTNAPYVLAKLGDTAAAARMIAAMESNDRRPWFTDVARASTLLATGDTARALDALERSARTSGPLWISFIPLTDPAYDGVRHSRRFAALVRQAGLNVGAFTSPRGLRR